MGLFDLFSEAKESIERSSKARDYVYDAKRIVKDGEDIYWRAYSKVDDCARKTSRLLNEHNTFKSNIAKELGSNIGQTLQQFTKFNIDTKIASMPEIKNVSSSSFSTPNFSSSISSIAPNPFNLISFCSADDYYEAKSQYNDAKRYKEQMKYERDRLYRYRDQMQEVQSFIYSEQREIETLMSKLRTMISDLKNGMKKSQFTQEEAEYLNGVHHISKCLVDLLSTEFLVDGFSISSKYKKVYDGIQALNSKLPSAPSISDPTTLRVLKDMCIVY